ncbi:MAG: hypothetical protein JWO94_2276 [Verrucomicrobiaceae bacterium]|nr:hypothetical protein [Verrucomicrobiaceae bacterium]
MSASQVIVAAMSLHRLPGVGGLLLQKGRNRIASNLPYSESRVEDLAGLLVRMAEGYRQVKRDVRQVWLEYDGGRVLILQQHGTQLVLVLSAKADVDLVSGAAAMFLSEHVTQLAMLPAEPIIQAGGPSSTPAIQEMVVTRPQAAEALIAKVEATISVWPQARKALESLLGKVMGRAQIANLVDRCIKACGVDDPYRMTPEQLHAIGQKVLDQVPNKSKRAALASELTVAFKELNL